MRGDAAIPVRTEGAAYGFNADRVVVDNRSFDIHEREVGTAYVLFQCHRLSPQGGPEPR